jgi:circadian clock protein KaiB
MQSTINLKLYVAGQTPRTQRIIDQIAQLCERYFAGTTYDLTVVDVIQHPEQAEAERIMATPTLVREHPPPRRLIIGDFSDAAKVIRALDLNINLAKNDVEDRPL